MILKKLIGLIFAGALVFSTAAAQVYVRVGPPHYLHEQRGPRPSRDHAWVSGYHRWDGNAYAWSPGRWEQPPRRHAHWERHHWVHRHQGWMLVDGRWR